MIFFPISIPLNWPSNLTWDNALSTLRNINLSPLYFLNFSSRPFTLFWLLVDFGLNLLVTIPFGYGISVFYKPRFFRLCFWALLTGLILEGIQLLVKLVLQTYYHTVDINDVILNALGVILGYCFFVIAHSAFRKIKRNETTYKVEKQD